MMTRHEYRDLVLHCADERAVDAFDAMTGDVQQWVREAGLNDQIDSAYIAHCNVVWSALELFQRPHDPDTITTFRRAVEELRNEWVDLCGSRGDYYAQGEDDANSILSDEAERQREIDIEQVGLRG